MFFLRAANIQIGQPEMNDCARNILFQPELEIVYEEKNRALDSKERLAQEAAGYVDQGFRALKMKVGLGIEDDTGQVEFRARYRSDCDLLIKIDADMVLLAPDFVERVVRDATAYTEHAKRKTVTAGDVVNSLKKFGRMLYGYA